jgi:hypothetical protein
MNLAPEKEFAVNVYSTIKKLGSSLGAFSHPKWKKLMIDQ